MEPRLLTHVPAEKLFIPHQPRVAPGGGRPILHPRFMSFTNYLGPDESYFGTRTCKMLRCILSRNVIAGVTTVPKIFGILMRFRNWPFNLQFIRASWLDNILGSPIFGKPSPLSLPPPSLVFFTHFHSWDEVGSSRHHHPTPRSRAFLWAAAKDIYPVCKNPIIPTPLGIHAYPLCR